MKHLFRTVLILWIVAAVGAAVLSGNALSKYSIRDSAEAIARVARWWPEVTIEGAWSDCIDKTILMKRSPEEGPSGPVGPFNRYVTPDNSDPVAEPTFHVLQDNTKSEVDAMFTYSFKMNDPLAPCILYAGDHETEGLEFPLKYGTSSTDPIPMYLAVKWDYKSGFFYEDIDLDSMIDWLAVQID